jgi:hypothetical protein
MRRLLIVGGALLAFAAPVSTAVAAKPTKADKREAKAECRAERGTTDATRTAFKEKYGRMGNCVVKKAKEAKAERKAAQRSASEDCRGERAEDRAAFEEKYGTNDNNRNAMGKCVSAAAKAKQKKQDEADAKEAARIKRAAEHADDHK